MVTTTAPAADSRAREGAASAPVAEPNFFIVGAPRAGTSSLWRYLGQHPEVFMTALKEPTFFCHTRPPHGIATLEDYLALFADARGHKAIGEASPDYFASPESPGLIHGRYPDAKIIIILRNPVDRAYSLYRLSCSLGVERMSSFERALAREEDRLNSERFKEKNPVFWRACIYFRAAFNSESIHRYQQLFSRERVHVLLLKDLKRRPIETMRAVYSFLGVDPQFVPDFDVRNKSEYPLSVPAQWVLHRVWARYARARRRRGRAKPTAIDRVFEAAFRLNNSVGTRLRVNKVKPSTRQALAALYRKDTLRTADLIGRDLSDWLA